MKRTRNQLLDNTPKRGENNKKLTGDQLNKRKVQKIINKDPKKIKTQNEYFPIQQDKNDKNDIENHSEKLLEKEIVSNSSFKNDYLNTPKNNAWHFFIIFFAFALRLLVIFISSYYDKSALVKYTDVDYYVFSDASRFVYQDPLNGTPYDRKTYRYTPILAYLLLPNFILSPMFGKIIFSIVDIIIAWLIIKIGTMYERKIQQSSHKKYDTLKTISSSSWMIVTCLSVLFNPIVFNISTRGNADQLVLLLVLLSLYYFFRDRYLTSAFFYGLSVHFKIYPIIYAPAFFLALADRKFNPGGRVYPSKTLYDKIKRTFKLLFRGLLNIHLWLFTLLSASVFLLLGLFFYKIYGYQCIYETYLYHLIRSDNRHNFSVYFYHIYLSIMEPSSLSALFMFVPQALVLLLMSFFMYRNILECILVQTMTFVAFNKVCTVQYFVWYIPLLSFMLLRSLDVSQKSNEETTEISLKWKSILLNTIVPFLIWFSGQGIWLQSAFDLEFLGKNSFLRIWVSGLLFFSINIGGIIYILLTKKKSSI